MAVKGNRLELAFMHGTTRYVGLLLLTIALVRIGVAQTPGGTVSGANAGDPQPVDATRAILSAFETFRVVALGDRHGTKDLNDFTLSLVRHPAFPTVVNDIVVECTNSLLQPTLDRYIAGEDVPFAEARRLWRDQTHPPCSVDDFHALLFQVIRRINQKLPPARRLRVLAGEPPIDWHTVRPETHREFLERRDAHAASVVEKEVLARNRKPLMLYGAAHLFHGVKQMAVGRYEDKYPGVTFVIAPYVGAADISRCGLPAFVDGTALDTRLASWPVPSLARTKGTWLADFAKAQFSRQMSIFGIERPSDPIDAYLYLGPPDLLLAAPPSAFAFLDKEFMSELHRRGTVMTSANYRDDRIEPDKVGARDTDVFVCGPTRSR
jgi:hypothetical protein